MAGSGKHGKGGKGGGRSGKPGGPGGRGKPGSSGGPKRAAGPKRSGVPSVGGSKGAPPPRGAAAAAVKSRAAPSRGPSARPAGPGRSKGASSTRPAKPVAASKPGAPSKPPTKQWYAHKPRKAKQTRAPLPTVHDGTRRSGFALLFGKPNVGKSTLMNRLVGEHIAAVSPKPQTTRTRILGVVTRPDVQLCLLDVPGVHAAKSLLNQSMVEAAMSAVSEVDVVLYLAESGWPVKKGVSPELVDPVGPAHRELLGTLGKLGKPVILVLTKVDVLPRALLLPVLDAWQKAYPFKELYPLSGLTGENVDGFIDMVRPHLPEGVPLFPEDTLTDQSERSICAELIREQVFLQTRDEVPYGAAVEIDSFDEAARGEPEETPAAEARGEAEAIDDDGDDDELESDELEDGEDEDVEGDEADDDAAEDELDEEDDEEETVELDAEAEAAYRAAIARGEDPLAVMNRLVAEAQAKEAGVEVKRPLAPGLVRIAATIILERDSHKGIAIGKGGSKLRDIGKASREKIEALLGCRVWLELFVKVVPGWTEQRRLLHEMGLDGTKA